MKIERIEVRITELPVRVKRIFSSGSWDTGPAGQLLGKPVFLRLIGEGLEGHAQIRPISPGHFLADTSESVVTAIREVYGPLLIGRRVTDMEAIDEALTSRLAGNPCARALIDIALHDAAGKAAGLPVHALLGGCAQPEIELEWSVSLAPEVSTMIEEAQQAVDTWGVRVLCLKAAGPGGWRADVATFAKVRAALGDDVVIGVDPNTGWTVAETIAAMEALRDHGLGYCEQPVERRDLRGMAEIRANARGVPVMADEGLFTIQDAAAHAHHRAADVFCVKLYKVGGLMPACKIAAIGEAHGILMNSGGLAVASQFEAAASAHFCATLPRRRTFGAAEFAFGVGPKGDDPLVADGAMRLKDGRVSVPKGPGLGLTLDLEALERMTLKKIEISA